MSKPARITAIICATVLVLGLGALSVWSGATIDLGEVLAALAGAAAGVLGTLGVRR